MRFLEFILGLFFIGCGLYYYIHAQDYPYKFANIIVMIVGVFILIKSFWKYRQTPGHSAS